MTIDVHGQPKRLGIALSGGGFRAAAFHLGVLQKLKELKLLEKIDVFSCVSGGSIAGGCVAVNWAAGGGLDRLEQYLRTRSVAVSSVIGGLVDPFHTRLEKLAQSYDVDLFRDATLADLAGGPRFYFNATNIATGNLWFFVAGGGGAPEMGEHELGVVAAPAFRLSRAVAASSAFPPVFPPLLLTKDVYVNASKVEYVTLSDGGVYDNMGVGPLLAAINKLDYMVVSDGGMPFSLEERPTESGALVLKASLSIMMEQIRGLEFDRMKHRYAAGAGPKPLWFSIDSAIGADRPSDPRLASSIGTNLSRLNETEMEVLTRHGGALLTTRINRFAPELLPA